MAELPKCQLGAVLLVLRAGTWRLRARRIASVGPVNTQQGWRMRFRRIICSDCWRARKQGGPVGVRMLINSVSCSSLSNRQRVSTLNAIGSGEIVYVSCTGNTPGNACALTFFARQGFGVVVVPLVARCSTRIGGTVDGGNIAPPNQNLAAAALPPSSSATAPGARPRACPLPPSHPQAQRCGLTVTS